MAYNLEGLYK